MTDNTTLPGTGEVYASTDKGGVKYSKVILDGLTGHGAAGDAFGRLRVSMPKALFSSKLVGLDNAPLLWDEQLESGAGITASTPTADKAYIDYTSTINTAGVFTRQTFARFNYQPGKSQLVLMTGVLDLSGGGTGVERCIGQFDDNNGAFFTDNAGTIQAVTRTKDSGSVVDDTAAQTAWNLDKMDGAADSTNPSGLTVDWTKAQIFVIDYQWLSVGRVRFGLEIDGQLFYVHEHNHANVEAIPWTSTPNLPLRYQMITTSSSPASTMRVICATVLSEGGQEELGVPVSESTITHVDANTADTVYALVGIRLKSTHLSTIVTIDDISGLSETADNFEWQLIHNPTVAGTFTYSDKTNSACQTALGATANTVTNGHIIARGFVSTSSPISTSIKSLIGLGSAIDGTMDTLVLCARPLGANADIQGAIDWTESS